MERTKMVRGLPFLEIHLLDKITRIKTQTALNEMRKQVADITEMTLDEINEEIRVVRAERKVIR